jgi:hypothetical protein
VNTGDIVAIGGHRLHVYLDAPGEWAVWLNTEIENFDGLCIGLGDTRDNAIAAAVTTLADAIVALQQHPTFQARPTAATRRR